LTSLKLDISENSIGVEGAVKLGEGVSKLQKLTSLNLNICKNSIGIVGSVKLGECISKLHNLTSLNLDIFSNRTNAPKGLALIGKSISTIATIPIFQIKIEFD
jgi:hypothetical protein